MENTVETRLQSIQLGEPQLYKNIAILPLIAPADGAFQYSTLGEALASRELTITEISTTGSVPDLLAVNSGHNPILLVDGEELAGAKQNRVLNTSILLKEMSKTKIPVSCTEQGRWRYTSEAFSGTSHIMAHKVRSRKSSSVHASLLASGMYASNQGGVWADIAELQAKAGVHTPTSAMSDVFQSREEDLRKCDEIFTPVAGQLGLLVSINGQIAGLDMVSRTSAYAKLHSKLVRSYTLESLLETVQQIPDPETICTEARKFMADITAMEEQQFQSLGYGTDYRYRSRAVPPPIPSNASPLPQRGEGRTDQPSVRPQPGPRNPILRGSALVHEKEVIHASFFRLDEPDRTEHMASFRRRRQFSQ
jgi:hypothetical protein